MRKYYAQFIASRTSYFVVLRSTVDDKLNDPTNKCTFDLRNTTNALLEISHDNISAPSRLIGNEGLHKIICIIVRKRLRKFLRTQDYV